MGPGPGYGFSPMDPDRVGPARRSSQSSPPTLSYSPAERTLSLEGIFDTGIQRAHEHCRDQVAGRVGPPLAPHANHARCGTRSHLPESILPINREVTRKC